MNETLILMLGGSPEDPVRWALLGPEGVRAADAVEDGQSLALIAERADSAERVVAILPGESVAMRAMPSPPRVDSKFRAAAMYLLEDDLAEPLEELHIAVQRRETYGAAFAIKRAIMDAWRDCFADAGFSPDILAADFSLLNDRVNQGVVIFEADRLICAIGDRGFAAERPLADHLAASLVADETIDDIVAYGDPQTERFDVADKQISWAGSADDVRLLTRYAEAGAARDAPNLLQGGYRKRRDWRGGLAPWRRTAVLAATCLAAFLGVVVTDGVRSARIASTLNNRALEIHRTAFPEAANVNPRDHARRMLSTGQSGPAFLALTANLAETLGEEAPVQVDRIRFNAARGEFAVNVSFADINDLEALKASLAARGVSVRETGGVRRTGGRYIGELQVDAS
ncbi:MAG: type II secretion system protein GspL [Hyphococcus sp.]